MSQSPPPVTIGAVIRHGRIFDPKNRDNSRVDELPGNVMELLGELEERAIPYAIAGAIAVLSYVEGRNTQDLDILLRPADLARIPGLEVLERNADFAGCRFGALQVDALLTSNQLFRDVLEHHRVRRMFEEREAWCADLEGLVMLKLYALPSLYRQGDFARAARFEHDVWMLRFACQADIHAGARALNGFLEPRQAKLVAAVACEVDERIRRTRERVRMFE